jgi:hypothetical protein
MPSQLDPQHPLLLLERAHHIDQDISGGQDGCAFSDPAAQALLQHHDLRPVRTGRARDRHDRARRPARAGASPPRIVVGWLARQHQHARVDHRRAVRGHLVARSDDLAAWEVRAALGASLLGRSDRLRSVLGRHEPEPEFSRTRSPSRASPSLPTAPVNSSAVMPVMIRSADMPVAGGRSRPGGRPSNGMTFVTARPGSSADLIHCCRYGGRQRSAARPPPSAVCSCSGFAAPASFRSARTVASSSPCRCSSGTTKPSTRSRSCMSSVMASSTADCS